jgi:colanic acid biosynthesis glycosyl transferase WcaI
LIVCQHFWPESFRVTDLALFFHENDWEVDVLCGLPNYPKGKLYDGYSVLNRSQIYKGVAIRRSLEVPRGNNSTIRIFLNYISFPFFSLFEIPRLLTKKYDKILIYQLSPVMMALPAIIIAKIKKVEVTMYVLDLWPENLFSVLKIKNKLAKNIITAISHWHYKQVDKLVVLTEKMNNQLEHISSLDQNKIITLPQPSEKIYETVIDDKSLSIRFKDTFNITYAGNISPAQSPETIVGAAKILASENINNLKWIIVGDGMSRQHMMQLVADAGLNDNFVFEGMKPVEDLPRYTSITDVFIGSLVNSNLLEATIPAKVMSYIASAKPIVLAMDGEVQQLINNTIKCGYAGPTEDAAIMANNIKKVYKLSTNERKKMGENARKYHFANLERNLVLNKLKNFIIDS